MVDRTESNTEREQRILDAANELILHYGYDKTTVSDIAAAARVSKGAIYLHFQSKDALFEALLMREMWAYGEEWLAAVEADPQGATLGGLYKNTITSINRSPFMRAIFTQDARVLGNYLHKPDNVFGSQQAHLLRADLVKALQEAGTIRRDVDPEALSQLMEILGFGYVAYSESQEGAEHASFEAVFNLIGEMMDRAFTPDTGADAEAGKAAIREVTREARKLFESEKAGCEESSNDSGQ